MRPSTYSKVLPGMKIPAIIFLLTAGLLPAVSQPLENEFPATYIDFSFGYSIPLKTMEKGEITDQLIRYGSHFSYVRYLSATRFFNDRIGFNLHWQSCNLQEQPGQDPSFYNQITDQYNANYYLIATEHPPGTTKSYGRDFSQGYFGLVYRLASERFFVLPRLSFGYTSFSATEVVVRLKEKNSNLYQTIGYDHDKYQDGYFTTGLGATAGWRVFGRIFLTAECHYTWFRPDFTYTINQRNLAEQTSTTRLVDYTSGVHTLMIGFGVTYEFDYKTIGVH